MHKQTIMTIMIIGIGLLNICQSAKVAALMTTNTTTVNFTKIIGDKFTIAETSSLGVKFPALSQVRVISESPHTVVLFGDLMTAALNDNIYLWQAMDLLKSYGFKLTQIVHDGVGSEGNPGRVYLIMERT